MTKNHFMLIHHPVFLNIVLPPAKSNVNEQSFNVGDGAFHMTYFKEIDNGIPSDVYDIIHGEKPVKDVMWDDLKFGSPSLATTVAECLLRIGIRC